MAVKVDFELLILLPLPSKSLSTHMTTLGAQDLVAFFQILTRNPASAQPGSQEMQKQIALQTRSHACYFH